MDTQRGVRTRLTFSKARDAEASWANEKELIFTSEGEGEWQVSVEGGGYPRWSPKGNELFFATQEGLMSAKVTARNGFTTKLPQKLFDWKHLGLYLVRRYDVSPDGRQFAVVRETGAAKHTLVIAQNWQEKKTAAPWDIGVELRRGNISAKVRRSIEQQQLIAMIVLKINLMNTLIPRHFDEFLSTFVSLLHSLKRYGKFIL